ncbi:hypothetical protein CLHOM_09150 [Clostridium homopropionicum DSM 5847]|uniref:DUF4363 family protein n=1 Tax=Clostridium homopropionicum DSM 5847 TaxID=1121318 RepID=A0A0L6ZDB6_9CLOT|nr:DUF4363 family protein [Clostridium homopropionicum]KOA20773.1 hypothetical protein CLHOM_09150 [Clostridium homopropionicum DSM 5847]SFF89488.1 protein of unknown function [Clostridium homopropionicum]
MRNLVISFLIFIILIITIVFSINFLISKTNYYSEKANQLETLVIQDSWDKAYDISTDFLNGWEKDSKKISIFINHFHIDAINNEILKLTQYIKYQDKSDALAIIHDIKFLLKVLLEMEKVTISNIF